ncbi:hypothetical protein FACS1894164_07980 [Spirochaetia bacterium]|nr:hypothetical protein FACS1894164_07980 [Spirochaetia bacterium]
MKKNNVFFAGLISLTLVSSLFLGCPSEEEKGKDPTADVTFELTTPAASATATITGGGATKTVNVAVPNTASVVLTVTKAAAQTLDKGGTAADDVDLSTTGDTSRTITIDTTSAVPAGGTKSFTVKVSESDKEDITYTVNVTVAVLPFDLSKLEATATLSATAPTASGTFSYASDTRVLSYYNTAASPAAPATATLDGTADKDLIEVLEQLVATDTLTIAGGKITGIELVGTHTAAAAVTLDQAGITITLAAGNIATVKGVKLTATGGAAGSTIETDTAGVVTVDTAHADATVDVAAGATATGVKFATGSTSGVTITSAKAVAVDISELIENDTVLLEGAFKFTFKTAAGTLVAKTTGGNGNGAFNDSAFIVAGAVDGSTAPVFEVLSDGAAPTSVADFGSTVFSVTPAASTTVTVTLGTQL